MLVHAILFSHHVEGTSFHNAEMFSIIRDNAELFSAGDYSIRSATTNRYLTFRRKDRVGLVLQDDYATVRMEQDAQYGKSGDTEGLWFGTVISGCGMCGSSQYGYPGGQGKIIAMAAYSCRAGEPGQAGGEKPPIPIAKRELGVSRGGEAPFYTMILIMAADFLESFTELFHLVKCSKSWTADGIIGNPIELEGQGTQETPTRRRSLYEGPTEPVARHRDGTTTRQRHRRTFGSSTSANGTRDVVIGKKRLERRELKSGCYCIIGEDHLLDQTTRAVVDKQLKTYDTFVDVAMADLNCSDHGQQWIVEQASEGSPSSNAQCAKESP
ncbi:BZ3500_MvSof-1268-A1-R1_Chr4-2g07104 [Microbotryum saponariae]|uniref:BZ3500_MvSof-1268-A1-R1_Chr4-2g07104 protein n=1 Tax=Microbotryum saponariae TaxID=289078 RepID=A0A2X0KZ76_9BASI|nr:BZ3500_MvSof-1268-A1-R1_Chr4-2g07104 [Microbotryum saponariae]SDA06769.1 BZ3501_MvSof-1269-A2-R1_Chr4-2g06815 [Microbotryum saponariae]